MSAGIYYDCSGWNWLHAELDPVAAETGQTGYQRHQQGWACSSIIPATKDLRSGREIITYGQTDLQGGFRIQFLPDFSVKTGSAELECDQAIS